MWKILPVLLVAAAHQSSELNQKIATIAEEARGKVGVAALVLETGQSAALNGAEKFPMQSVYKLPISMAVLAKVERGELTLEQKVRVTKNDLPPADSHSPLRDKHPEGNVDFSIAELIRAAVSMSDNLACDLLMHIVGGGKPITDYLRDLGLKDIIVANTEAEMAANNDLQYRNTATPEDAVLMLRLVHEGRGLSPASRDFLLKALTETSTGPKRIKGLLPPDAVVAHKTGTSKAACNDIGIITLPDGKHLALAVFVADAAANLETRENVIARTARAAWDHWSAPARTSAR